MDSFLTMATAEPYPEVTSLRIRTPRDDSIYDPEFAFDTKVAPKMLGGKTQEEIAVLIVRLMKKTGWAFLGIGAGLTVAGTALEMHGMMTLGLMLLIAAALLCSVVRDAAV